jgi:hypothetical protein
MVEEGGGRRKLGENCDFEAVGDGHEGGRRS